jgi:formate hydrogenlyase transcriptional activator
MTNRQHTIETNLDERLRFEMMLSEMSANLINVSYDGFDAAIIAALKKLVNFLGFDRSSILELTHEGMRLKYSGAAEGVSPMQGYIAEEEIPWIISQFKTKKIPFYFASIDEMPKEAERDKVFFKKHGPASTVGAPMIVGDKVIGVIAIGSTLKERHIPKDFIERTHLIATIFANALVRRQTEEKLHKAFSEIKELKDQLTAECGYLREEIELTYEHGDIIGRSPEMLNVLSQAEQVAPTDSTVLLMGETGTGKEVLAHTIHNISGRKNKTMIKINCAALPAALIESELFGREKGAYTGATQRQIGRFELASGSTIFLDEISELPLELQTKLLRVIQERQLERLGGTKTITVDIRIIAATNRNLAELVKEGRFREDLFYRLNVFPITIPPLRARREDIPLLTWTFVKEYELTMGKTIKRIPSKTMESLQSYSWPGNIRELKNILERAMILSQGSQLEIATPDNKSTINPQSLLLEELEKNHILEVLKKCGWRIRGAAGAAELLGIKPTTLDSKIKKLRILRRPDSEI